MPTIETDETKIALIGQDITYIRSELTEVRSALKDMSNLFITKQTLEGVAILTERRLQSLEGASHLWKILSPTFASILGSVLTFLLVSYLQNSR